MDRQHERPFARRGDHIRRESERPIHTGHRPRRMRRRRRDRPETGQGGAAGLGQDTELRPRRGPHPARRGVPGVSGRAHRQPVRRTGQGPGPGDGGGRLYGRLLRKVRRHGPFVRGGDRPVGQRRRDDIRAPRTRRSVRRHLPLELPPLRVRTQSGPRPPRRMHRRRQVVRADAPHHLPLHGTRRAGDPRGKGGPPGGGRLGGHRIRLHDRRGPLHLPRPRHHLHDRIGRHRPADHAQRRRTHDEGVAGAGREGSLHRHGRRAAGRGGGRHRLEPRHLLRTGVQLRREGVRAGGYIRRLPGEVRGQNESFRVWRAGRGGGRVLLAHQL
mmetsp:Transcript_35115/g.69214  ORF Transcript_35115/g.69214 Transcript_35115/m.69214 type:complete len:328 (+) Transcript_35115:210-1193(+)